MLEELQKRFGNQFVFMDDNELVILVGAGLEKDEQEDLQSIFDEKGFLLEIDYTWNYSMGDDLPSALVAMSDKMKNAEVLREIYPYVGSSY